MIILDNMENVAVILGGGSGKRFGASLPKQFLILKDRPLFLWSIFSFLEHPAIDKVVFVYNKFFLNDTQKILEEYKLSGKIELVEGGQERQLSVYNALKYLERYEVKNVLIHDSARPLIDKDLITKILDCLEDNYACVPVVRLKESICKVADHEILSVENREQFRIVQTPQGFDYRTIKLAHEEALRSNIKNSFDDSSLVLLKGGKVRFIEGDPFNIKVTYREDLQIVGFFMDLKNLKGG